MRLSFAPVRPSKLSAGEAPEAAYLVVHKRPWQEIEAAAARYRVTATTPHRIDPRALRVVFADTALRLDRAHPLADRLVHEDDQVAVYDLRPAAVAR